MKILLVNSTKSFYKAVKESLKGLEMKVFESIGVYNAIDDIKETKSNIVILNWANADFDIIDICKKIRKLRHIKYVYVIVVIKRDNQKEMNKVMDAGADDYLFKPFGKDEVILRTKVAKKIIKLENNLADSKKKVMNLAKEDPLTNLLNRRALMDAVLVEMGRAAREMKFLSAIMTKVSNFKDIVDVHGIKIGDAILAEYGRRLQTTCRPYDEAGRYGISEFLVFLPDTGIDNAEKVAKRLLSSVTKRPFKVKGEKIDVFIAIGISDIDPQDVSLSEHVDDHLKNDLLLDSLIRRSEIAMEKAAETGDNDIEIFV